jgi:hypothetical protein
MNAPSQNTKLQATNKITAAPIYSVTGYRSVEGKEGPCFNATIRRDGRKVGLVHDNGNGGCHTYDMPRAAETELLQAAEAWASGDEYEVVDSFIDHLIDEMFIAKDKAKMVKAGYPVVLLMSYPEPVVIKEGLPFMPTPTKPSFLLGLKALEQIEEIRRDKEYAGMIVRVL